MKVRYLSVALLALVLAIACGGGPGMTPGYYLADDIKEAHYPLVVIQKKNGHSSAYQISKFGSVSFGAGVSTTDLSEDTLSTALALSTGNDWAYNGILTMQGKNLRVRSARQKEDGTNTRTLRNEKELSSPSVEVLQDVVLKSVPKEKAIQVLRATFKFPAQGEFSSHQEEVCQGAFDMSCDELYRP
ncbi:hypothetical protein K2X33_00955 [bacterium]|nr:hypothetical protein [bacterium]